MKHLTKLAIFAAAFAAPSLQADETKLTYDAVDGFINTYCIKCHTPEKKKGGLIMSSYDQLMAGGKHQAKGKLTVSAGKSGESLMIQSMALPLEDEDHMPPEEKPQPTAEEIAFIKWWIDDGAKKDAVIKDAGMTDDVKKTALALLGKAAGSTEKKEETPAAPEAPKKEG